MTMFDAIPWRKELARPRGAGRAVVAVIVALVPRRAIEPVAGLYQRAIEPGRIVAGYLSARCTEAAACVAIRPPRGARWPRSRPRRAGCRPEIASWKPPCLSPSATRPILRHRRAHEPPPLVVSQVVRAQVLGRRACAALGIQEIIDRGRASGTTVGRAGARR